MSFVCLSGLPRTGSTLLSAILSQNPDIHAEGNSAVCQLMWDLQQSCEVTAAEQLKANYRQNDQDVLVSAIPNLYYRNVTKQHIVDKCRSWTLPANMAMLRRYVTSDPKVIVLVRPIEQIVDSFIRLYQANNKTVTKKDLLEPGTEPITRSVAGVEYARANNKGEFLFIEYYDLINNPGETLNQIYTFCGWKFFQHDFQNVINIHEEDDTVYGLAGMHSIRPKVGPCTT